MAFMASSVSTSGLCFDSQAWDTLVQNSTARARPDLQRSCMTNCMPAHTPSSFRQHSCASPTTFRNVATVAMTSALAVYPPSSHRSSGHPKEAEHQTASSLYIPRATSSRAHTLIASQPCHCHQFMPGHVQSSTHHRLQTLPYRRREQCLKLGQREGLSQSGWGLEAGRVGKKRRSCDVQRVATRAAPVAFLNPIQSPKAVWAVLCACAALGQVLENRTSWGGQVSAPLLAMSASMILATMGLLPPSSPAYNFVWSLLMPMAVALTLLETDIRDAFTNAGQAFQAFWLGALATIIGTVVAFSLVGSSLGVDGWKAASCFCASYIGGSINYAATAQALGLGVGSSSSASAGAAALAAGMAADNLLTAAFFAVLAALPSKWSTLLPERFLRTDPTANADAAAAPMTPVVATVRRKREEDILSLMVKSHDSDGIISTSSNSSSSDKSSSSDSVGGGGGLTVESAAVSLAVAAVACALADFISLSLPPAFAGFDLGLTALIASLISSAVQSTAATSASVPENQEASGLVESGADSGVTSAAGNATSSAIHKPTGRSKGPSDEGAGGQGAGVVASNLFQGAGDMGAALMLLFFATIGATASLSEAVSVGGGFIAFVGILLTIHLLVILLLGYLARIPLHVVIVASNANVGGPATATAMASARKWPDMVRPAILIGTLGYTIGTAISFVVGNGILKAIPVGL